MKLRLLSPQLHLPPTLHMLIVNQTQVMKQHSKLAGYIWEIKYNSCCCCCLRFGFENIRCPVSIEWREQKHNFGAWVYCLIHWHQWQSMMSFIHLGPNVFNTNQRNLMQLYWSANNNNFLDVNLSLFLSATSKSMTTSVVCYFLHASANIGAWLCYLFIMYCRVLMLFKYENKRLS